MLKLGVPLGLAVDGSASNDGSSMMEEMRAAYLMQRLSRGESAPTGYDILKMATRGSAELLGRDDIGSIEEGKCADMFMIDMGRIELVGACFDPKSVLATVGFGSPVDYTIVGGKVTVRQGRLCKTDERKMAELAGKKVREYLKRQ